MISRGTTVLRLEGFVTAGGEESETASLLLALI